MTERSIYDSISPIDFRYYDEEEHERPLLSENGFIFFKLQVERALAYTLYYCDDFYPKEVADEIMAACSRVTAEEVYAEEKNTRHDIRALVNCIRNKVSDAAKPYVHLTATSYDIIDTANAWRFKSAVICVLIPELVELVRVLIDLTLREADTPQIGRTHGQHAVPITFGFAIAGYVSRLGQAIQQLKKRACELKGKFSGAVGAYNASSLLFDNPERLEVNVLDALGLEPAEHSTQIVPPEPMTRLLCEVTIVAGILANLADDMRHLMRTEIGEVGEAFEIDQVGSSTMPQKRNPINLENVKSVWKVVVSRIAMVFMDQVSEHQRDLTNSASGRTYGEIIAYTVAAAKRLTSTMRKLTVDRANMQRNFELTEGMIAAEPLYILLASLGHTDAHEKVRRLTLQAQHDGITLQTLIAGDAELKPYLEKLTDDQRAILSDPSRYTGIASDKAREVANHWKQQLEI